MNAEFKNFWHRAFLEERPSLGLCLFRPFVAFTVGAHVIPTLLHMQDNYLASAFREKNPSFFTPEVLLLIDQSPDWLVRVMAALFYVSLSFFALGLFSQVSCTVMTLSLYYFYALNSLHIGTLSFDILLVTLFLMCVTGYHGDSLSLDALRRKKPFVNDTPRPFFVQRLLQLQIAATYFYTGLCKFPPQGNWLTQNPIHYLLNSTPESVVKEFPLRSFFAQSPDLCYLIGLSVMAMELSLPFLWFLRRTRLVAILIGFAFHILLLVTLHVPTIFFFLFPPQFLLFLDPETYSPKSCEVKT